MVGTRIRHFFLKRSFHEAAWGEVYRARDEQLNRDVAIKFLPERLAEPDSSNLFEIFAQVQLADAPLKIVGLAAQKPGSVHHVPARLFQRSADCLLLKRLECLPKLGYRGRYVTGLLKDFRGQILRTKAVRCPKDHGPTNGATEFSDISRPRVLLQHADRLRVGRAELTLSLALVFLKEKGREQRDVVQPLSERRQLHGQPHSEVEVGSETSLLNLFGEQPIRRRHQPHIDFDFA